jgi:hypothetical protein
VTDYKPVQDALAKGADPAMLCATCPWDRNCLTPPAMTSADVDARIAEMAEADKTEAARRAALGEERPMPVGALMATLVYAGRDTTGTLCPVFSLRLRSSGGRAVADLLKDTMQKWDDQQ